MAKIIFDLDGVVRDLHFMLTKFYGPLPPEWGMNFGGKDIYAAASEHPEILSDAPPTEYFEVIKAYHEAQGPAIIWTHQPSPWIPSMLTWMNKYLPGAKIKIKHPTDKFSRINETGNGLGHAWLVEDYPLFPHYDRIVLIDRPYNQKTKAKIRVKTPQELQNFIDTMKEETK